MNDQDSSNRERERVIALAGLFQAAELATQIARRGIADSAAMEVSLYSLFQVDAESVEGVYGGSRGLALGFQSILAQLGRSGQRNAEVARYAVALLHLERKLSKNREMLQRISEGIHIAASRLEHFNLLHANILAQLAEIYTETISTLKPRIMVQGEPLHLQNPENVNRIRSLLLAGIRSAMLWRQCGGSKLQILLGRGALVKQATQLLKAS